MNKIGAPGSPQPGKSLPTSFPPLPSKGDSTPDGRGRAADIAALRNSPKGPATVEASLESTFRQGLSSGGNPLGKGETIAPMKQKQMAGYPAGGKAK